jgi:hypothetical protein
MSSPSGLISLADLAEHTLKAVSLCIIKKGQYIAIHVFSNK